MRVLPAEGALHLALELLDCRMDPQAVFGWLRRLGGAPGRVLVERELS